MSIIGHGKIRDNMLEAINHNKLSHAHIFSGERGIGKSVLADYIAHSILGLKGNREHVDIKHWDLDKGKPSISVDTIRKIIEESNKRPFEGDKKVIIINNSDKITYQAQNAMLKTIEEPPAGLFIFLLCEDIDGIIDTIKSRCCIHKLRPLKDDEVQTYLKTTYPNASSDKIALAVAFAKGVPGRAESLLANDDFYTIRKTIFEIMSNVKHVDKLVPLKYEKFFSQYSDRQDDILDMFITVIRDIIIYKEVEDESLLINIDMTSEIKDLANIFSLSKLSDMIKVVEECRNILYSNVNSSLAFISMVLRMQEV